MRTLRRCVSGVASAWGRIIGASAGMWRFQGSCGMSMAGCFADATSVGVTSALGRGRVFTDSITPPQNLLSTSERQEADVAVRSPETPSSPNLAMT